MKLAVIILNWNAADDTIRCVQEISGWTRVKPVIIVVDNASGPEDVQAVKQSCPQVRLIASRINLGYAGGNNLGIEAALKTDDAPIMLLNNDATIAENDVLILLETLQNRPDIGIIGPPLYDAQQKDRLLSAGSKNPAMHHHSHNHQLHSTEPVQVMECVPGTIIIIRAEVFRRVGLLDETYFFSSEIADLCLNSAQKGLLCAIDIRAKGYHEVKRSSMYRGTLYPYYIIRNRFILIRKFHRRLKLFFYAFWTIYGLAMAIKLILSGNKPMARAVRLGTADGLKGQFGNQNARALSIINGNSR